jgi:formate hydrogenlyase transcriptional activator
LNVFPIEVPALRDRPEDIPLLVWHFARKFAERMNKQIEKIRTEDMEALAHYHWPGNVRELQNLMERSVILSSGSVLHLALPRPTLTSRNATHKVRTLAEAERDHILQALQDNDWRISTKCAGTASRAPNLTDSCRQSDAASPFHDEWPFFDDRRSALTASHTQT